MLQDTCQSEQTESTEPVEACELALQEAKIVWQSYVEQGITTSEDFECYQKENQDRFISIDDFISKL